MGETFGSENTSGRIYYLGSGLLQQYLWYGACFQQTLPLLYVLHLAQNIFAIVYNDDTSLTRPASADPSIRVGLQMVFCIGM